MLTIGDARLTMLNGGNFRLDGCAMHGVVPKTLWSKLVSCDAHNRCEYTTRCLLIDVGGRRILVETGNGDKFPAKLKEIYGIDHDRSIGDALRETGVEPESIDTVVMTHLHFDHSGGTTRAVAGGHAPVFARARHVIQRREWHDATHPHERNQASYLAENIAPLQDAQLVELVDGEQEVAPGVRVLPTPGHTRGHQSVLIDDGHGHKVLFLGDVVPTALHLRLPFIMAYDLDVVGTLESKRAILRRAHEEKWLLVFGHDTAIRAGTLGVDARGQWRIEQPFELA